MYAESGGEQLGVEAEGSEGGRPKHTCAQGFSGISLGARMSWLRLTTVVQP